jgi:hypothetical protein
VDEILPAFRLDILRQVRNNETNRLRVSCAVGNPAGDILTGLLAGFFMSSVIFKILSLLYCWTTASFFGVMSQTCPYKNISPVLIKGTIPAFCGADRRELDPVPSSSMKE